MVDYLVDNSAWSRHAQGVAGVVARIKAVERSPADLFVTCPPQVLEFCHSAPAGKHDEYRAAIGLGFPLEHHPDEETVLAIQSALWAGGLWRAVGPVDIHIAAYALVNDATVLACDRDYEHIARVVPEFSQEYVVP